MSFVIFVVKLSLSSCLHSEMSSLLQLSLRVNKKKIDFFVCVCVLFSERPGRLSGLWSGVSQRRVGGKGTFRSSV